MKKVIIVLVLFLFLLGCKNKTEEVKIGVILPLTGEGAFWGKNAQNGIDLAFEEVQKKELKYKYKLIYQDSKTKPKEAVNIFNGLINIENIKYCIVDMISSNVLAIAPIANENKVLILSPGASNPKITDAGDYVFRNWPSDALQGKEDAKIASEMLGWKKVAILKINNDYGEGLSSVFKSSLKENSKVIVEEAYKQGDSNFRTQLEKIKQAKPDGIYLLAYPLEIPIIFKQAAELNINVTFLGTETFETPDVIKVAGDAANGALYTFPSSPDTKVYVVNNFRMNYLKKYGKEFGTPGDVAYDALYLFINSIEKVGNDVDRVKKELYNTRDYQGASGKYSIDRNGDAIKSFDVKIIRNNKFDFYEKK